MRSTSRIANQKVYLAGPIDRCPLDGRVWRDAITPSLENLGLEIFDPLNKPCDDAPEDTESRAERRQWKSNGEYARFSTFMRKVVAIDLRLINTCDFIIALVDLDIHMCGTYEEVIRANDQKKPVLVICPQGKGAVPDWLFGKLPHDLFFNSAAEVLSYLDKVAYDDSPPDHLNRWMFFNNHKAV